MMEDHKEVVASAALLYEKRTEKVVVNKVFSVLISKGKEDDELSLKHKAERHMTENNGDSILGFKLAAWKISVSDITIPTTGSKND